MCSTCTRCAAGSMLCWPAKDARGWRVRASSSCRTAFGLISKAGRSKTSSPTSASSRGGGRADLAKRTAPAVAMSDSRVIERQNSAVASLAGTTYTGEAESDLAVARRVIRAEICGLETLAESLDGAFQTAVDICAAARGRIILTGIGKSGHIAHKIAATLASTGTPAQFVHPVEASHGDLGMIGSEDAILALSNSGETSELADIIAYSRRFRIPLVAVTAGSRSTLAEAADVMVLLPSAAEACPMVVALGDALALALLERKGFSSADFHRFHPGGRLGRGLLRVRDIMHEEDEIPLVSPTALMSEAILVMTAKSFGCVGVREAEGRLCGVITDGDLRRHMGDALLSQTVRAVMHENPKTIAASALAADALGMMNRFAITSLFVIDESGRPIGFLHMHDCLRAGVA